MEKTDQFAYSNSPRTYRPSSWAKWVKSQVVQAVRFSRACMRELIWGSCGSSGTLRMQRTTGRNTVSHLMIRRESWATQLAGTILDPWHSAEKQRFVTIGHS